MRAISLLAAMGAAMVLVAAPAHAAKDPIITCARGVLAGGAKLARGTLRARTACEARKRAGKLAAATACATEPKTAAAIAKASTALARALDKRCGGTDKRCGTPDDVSPAALGWPSACPNAEGAGCAAPIESCAGIAACVTCAERAFATDALGSVYPTNASTPDALLSKANRRCRGTIAKQAAKLAEVGIKTLTRCWDARLQGKHANPCPSPGDGAAAGTLAAATASARAKICKACGGPDGSCDMPFDGGAFGLGAAVAPRFGCDPAPGDTVAALVDQLACTVSARTTCATTLVVPGLAAYAQECDAPPPPAPSPTATPAPSATTTTTPTALPTASCPGGQPPVSQIDVTITLGSATAVGAASLILEYPAASVQLPTLGGGADVRARVTDLTNGKLFDKGGPNNQDEDADGDGDRVRFTLVAPTGVTGAILRVRFDRCDAAAGGVAADYTCALTAGTVVGIDGVTPVVGAACHVDVSSP